LVRGKAYGFGNGETLVGIRYRRIVGESLAEQFNRKEGRSWERRSWERRSWERRSWERRSWERRSWERRSGEKRRNEEQEWKKRRLGGHDDF
jgi:hypothetical protein